jgi:Flp pilus assembly protein TadD
MKSNDYNGAISDFSTVIDLEPNYSGAYTNRGLSKININDFSGALDDLNKVIEIDPKEPTAYVNRGAFKFEKGDFDGACNDWTIAGQLGYNDAYIIIKKFCE